MLKIIANKTLAFDRGEKDREGRLLREKTKVGYCELPEWVADTTYFKAAVKDGSLKYFAYSSEGDSVQKEMEKLAKLKEEIRALEERKEALLDAPVSIKAIEAVEAIDAELADQKEEVKAAKK
jgi:hypothetical protein